MTKYIDKVESNLKTANIVFLVFDMTDKSSFDSLSEWVKLIKNNCLNNVIVYILANKSDIGLINSQEILD